jgi:hypothetical protein
MCLRDIEAMREQAKADVTALRSEVGQLGKAEAAEHLPQEAQTHSPEAAQKQPPRPPAQPYSLRRVKQRFRRSKRVRMRCLLLSNWIRQLFRPFRGSSTNSAGSGLCFCSEEAATIWAREAFKGDATHT